MTVEARILLVGYGTVGQAFHELLADAAPDFARRFGVRPRVAGIVRSRGAWVEEGAHGIAPGGTLLAKRQQLTVNEVIERVQPDVLVELTPTDLKTGGAALDVIRHALSKSVPVVTANKGPLVVAYSELTTLAREHDVPFRFEGSVAGAIPTLNLHDHCLPGNPVTRVDGVLNGTSNFILTRMAEEGLGFQEALEEAQQLGYAEADPTADVDGWDAAAKLVILGNHVLGTRLALADVRVEGIRAITAGAMSLAESQGWVIRLVASVSPENGAVVAPRLVPRDSPLNVQGALNVVRFTTKHAGAFTLIGKGAGGVETATAVLSDVANVLKERVNASG